MPSSTTHNYMTLSSSRKQYLAWSRQSNPQTSTPPTPSFLLNESEFSHYQYHSTCSTTTSSSSSGISLPTLQFVAALYPDGWSGLGHALDQLSNSIIWCTVHVVRRELWETDSIDCACKQVWDCDTDSIDCACKQVWDCECDSGDALSLTVDANMFLFGQH